jgi:hypothetical protein
VAAGLSLYLSLSADKSVSIVSPSPTTVEFNRLVGVNKISQDLGNKNLVISFSDYKAEDIERVSYDIEDGEFRLTVIPKPGFASPQKGQVNLTYSGMSGDLVILVGGANEAHFPALSDKQMAGTRIIHVGNKQLSADPNKNILSFSGNSATVSEIVAYLINEAQLKVDSDVATNLLMGIEQGTESFTSAQANAQTFQLIASLMQLGGKRLAQQQPADAKDYPQGAIPGQDVASQKQTVQQQSSVSQVQQQKNVSKKADDKSVNNDADSNKNTDENQKNPPQDWLKPKIYKGTSIN